MGIKTITRALAGFFLFLNIGAALAAETGKIELDSRMWQQASAEATIKDSAADTKEITINADNLAPDSVYTVWFVKEGDGGGRLAIGDENSFRTDENGDGVFNASVPGVNVDDWDWIVVGFHPEGDPENLENLHVAFTGELAGVG